MEVNEKTNYIRLVCRGESDHIHYSFAMVHVSNFTLGVLVVEKKIIHARPLFAGIVLFLLLKNKLSIELS